MAFSIKRGSRGSKVKLVQRYLNLLLKGRKMTLLDEDGIFGPKTEQAALTMRIQLPISKAMYQNMKQRVIEYDKKQKKGILNKDLRKMNGEELVNFISLHDKITHQKLLEVRERAENLRKKGINTTEIDQALSEVAQSYANRQNKLSNNDYLSFQRGIDSKLVWLKEKWNKAFGISALPLAAPVVWGILILGGATAGIVVYRIFINDGYQAVKDGKKMQELEKLVNRIAKNPQDANKIVKAAEDVAHDAYKTGRDSGAFDFLKVGAPVAIAIGLGIILIARK